MKNLYKKIEAHTTLRYALLPLLFVMIGCGGPPSNNTLLTNATESFNRAEQDTMVVRYAPVALKEAEETLERSRSLWAAKADKSAVDHYAYLANQRTSIAVHTAALNAANAEISRSEVERQQVLLDVRQSEANRAEARARQAQQEAGRDRASADQARQSADESRLLAEEARRESALLAERISELEARPTDRGLVLTLGDVLFEFGKSSMRSGGMKSVDELAKFLKEYPDRKIMIEGFTDNVGSEAFNLELSRNRANAVKSELVSRGVNENRVDTVGYGFQFPVGNNATDAGRQQNRRVEIIISDQSGNVSRRTQ